jgi:hypothetical protein
MTFFQFLAVIGVLVLVYIAAAINDVAKAIREPRDVASAAAKEVGLDRQDEIEDAEIQGGRLRARLP